MVGDGDGLAFVHVILVGNVSRDTEGLRMERRLRDEPIWEWNSQEPGYKCGEAKQPNIPMEPSGFAKGELSSLGDER